VVSHISEKNERDVGHPSFVREPEALALSGRRQALQIGPRLCVIRSEL
jgi:hypothetical protein